MALVQIRDLPERAHRTLKARAAECGRTLSGYLRDELVELAAQPTPAEVWDSIGSRQVVRSRVSSAELIRRGRERD